jgi:hypothetical protein
MRDAPGGEARLISARLPPASRGAGSVWRTLPSDVKALVVVAGLIVTAGAGWGLFGWQQGERVPALLGYVDYPPLPPPSPPTRPPFKLPWWR